jgi:NAD(P)-dependent dehydrogenase (short-subunit alcohol dehydrogenase family)
LDGKVAIVTGGGSGIGRETSLILAEAGADVMVVGRTLPSLEATVEEIRRIGNGRLSARACTADVRREEELTAMVAETVEALGRIDILVCSAGLLRAVKAGPKPVAKLSYDEWSAVIQTNLRGTFLSSKAVLPTMIRQRSGDIIHLSSTSGLRGYAYDSAYCSSKFGIIGFSESLREEVRRFGIRVQTLLPGPVDTGIWEQNRPVPPPEKVLPVRRVAETITFLLALPRSTMMDHPTIIPFRPHHRPAWRTAGPGAHAGGARGESVPT